mmetsp:Transcript_29281/g.25895  ORF Transcript_29281/g.25895 Transcript_29281/m.25895 type:complete len:159 (+) Transcript_29281:75-551(+)
MNKSTNNKILDLHKYSHRSILKKTVKIQNFNVKTPVPLEICNIIEVKDLKKILPVLLKRDIGFIEIQGPNINTELTPYYRSLMRIVQGHIVYLRLSNFTIKKKYFEHILNSVSNLKYLNFWSCKIESKGLILNPRGTTCLQKLTFSCGTPRLSSWGQS